MAVKKLPVEVQSKIRASVKIRSFKTAIEELVYNALDANSSSIAIRVHIQENYIQVADNGCGVASNNFDILGQRYATSKFENPCTTKSIQKYGCYGQSLANLVEVSKNVKIISKCQKNAETWTKHFCNGKEECSVTTDRPSTGTTVEIKGFLYNLPIHRKAVKPLTELHNIKSFLEQMSLVHCNTSISLRDDSENEIIFKTHKNRGLVQTLASILNIDTCNLQEFQVEKNQYKVTGFIKNKYKEPKGYQWIFVNGRCIGNSNLHNIVNENLATGVNTKDKMKNNRFCNQNAQKGTTDARKVILNTFKWLRQKKDEGLSSIPVNNVLKLVVDMTGTDIHSAVSCQTEDEKSTSVNRLPDYFLFINCPRSDYEIISNPKQSILEFKNVPQVSKLLEKLVKFHKGDINLVNISTTKKPNVTLESSKGQETGTRNKVKQIIHKILGSQQRKMNGSNLRNGVKGKKIRRNAKKMVPSSKTKLKLMNGNYDKVIQEKEHVFEDSKTPPINNASTSFRVPRSKPIDNILANVNQEQRPLINEKHQHEAEDITKNKVKSIKNPLLSNFEKETGEVQKRCNMLAKRVDHLLGVTKKRKCKIFTNETVHYSKIVRDNKSISVRKKINEIITYEYLPLPHKTKNNDVNTLNEIKTSTDLIHPFMNIVNQSTIHKVPSNAMHDKIAQLQLDQCSMHVTEKLNVESLPGPTFESHGYVHETQISKPKDVLVEKYKMRQFISKVSQENFSAPGIQRKTIATSNVVKKQKDPRKLYNNKMHNDLLQSSYSIHFTTKTGTRENETDEFALSAADDISLSDKLNIGDTYTVTVVDSSKSKSGYSKTLNKTFVFDKSVNMEANLNDMTNVYLTSDESPYIQITQNETERTDARVDDNVVFISNSKHSMMESNEIEPLEICETVISGHGEKYYDNVNEEYTFIFDSINNVIEKNNPNGIQTRQTCKTTDETRKNVNSDGRKSEDDYLNKRLPKLFRDNSLDHNKESNNFNLKIRRRYIPKGMSPIFENCNLKNVCDYEFDEDYFEDIVYDNFVQNVEIQTEVFEPKIQNVKEAVTKDIQRVDNKLNKDNACFTFYGESLKCAKFSPNKVLHQVDNKFIATIIRGNSNGTKDYLVLFDQHAIHERIRLEQNMSEYITHEQWKSVSLDDVLLKLTKDEILYLHNHRDKFERLGLQWSISSDTQVLINAIPEAILGKHTRQVDVVLKAVKNLIKEEIDIIKEQGGCVSLYPKSIMDLVFSEACRYAIMFGDALSTRECASLVETLSRCKTPFQCAHGRPSMAVLVDIAREARPYKVNFARVKQFRSKQIKKLNK